MRHVIWDIGSSGPGVNAVRAFLGEYHKMALMKAVAPTDIHIPSYGDFDPNLKDWVGRFQKQFNYLLRTRNPTVTKPYYPKKPIPESGAVDAGTRQAMRIPESLAPDDAIKLPSGVTATAANLTASELGAARDGERFVGQAYRVADLTALLLALGLDMRSEAGTASTMRIAPLAEGRFLVSESHVLYGAAKENSECAALVQSFGVPATNLWRRGPRVQDVAALPPGTVVATLSSGVYLSDYSGKSHVGIFLRKNDQGFAMLDQWRGSGGDLGIRFRSYGARHTKTRVDPAKYINDESYSYRNDVPDPDGSYGRNYALETVRYRTNLINDASEYQVLLTNGQVARRDSGTGPRRHLTDQQVATEVVDYLLDGIDLGPSAGASKELREALEKMQPPK